MTDLFGQGESMPALSYWQPWGSLHVAGLKLHETRHWPTRVRGRFAIHAAKRLDRLDAPDPLCIHLWGAEWWNDLPRGAVVAIAELTGCYRTEDICRALGAGASHADILDDACGDFSSGRFGFRVENVRPLKEPIPCVGRQGFFTWRAPADLDAQLLAPVDRAAAAGAWAERRPA